MAVTAADVKGFAPQFAAVPDATVNLWLSWSTGALSSQLLQTDTDQAVMLWTCHSLTVTQGGAAGSVGAVTQRRVGDVSVTTSGPPASLTDPASWAVTAYGQALLRLVRRYTAGGVCV